MLKSSWRNDDGNGVIILKLLVLGGLYAAVVLLVSDILIAVFLTAEHEKFSELPRGGFLMRTGNFWSFTLLLIFCDASLVVVFLLHLLNAEAKLWMGLVFQLLSCVHKSVRILPRAIWITLNQVIFTTWYKMW